MVLTQQHYNVDVCTHIELKTNTKGVKKLEDSGNKPIENRRKP